MPDDLKSRIEGGEFDYLALLNALQEYARPRDRITALLRRGEIVRVKKGIYVFGEGSGARPFSREGPGSKGGVLTGTGVLKIAEKVIKILDVEEARREELPYLSDPGTVAAWSPEFFREAFCRIAMGDVLTAPNGS